MRGKAVTLIGIIMMIIALAAEVSLFVFANFGTDKDSPVVLLYGLESDQFPDTTFGMAMRRAGFEFSVMSKDLFKAYERGEEIGLPQGLRSKRVVILAQGKAATSSLKLFDEDEDTMGFVLIDPVFETNYSMEGMSSRYPVQDVAIFTSDSSEKSDAKIMYERLSGEDSLYGIYSKTGGIFSSETCINPEGNRFLSISHFEHQTADGFYYSPTFQIELANYLSATYGTSTVDIGEQVALWYAIYIFASLLFIAGLFVFLASFPILRYRMDSASENKLDRVSMILAGTVTASMTVAGLVFGFVGKLNPYLKYIMVFLPTCYVVLLAVVRIYYVIANRKVHKPRRTSTLLAVVLTLATAAYVFLVFENFVGISFDRAGENVMLLWALLLGILDFMAIFILSYADNISRSKGLGGCSYYGKGNIVVFSFLPSLICLMTSVMAGRNSLVGACITGLAAAVLPYLGSLPVKRHTASVRFTALSHALIMITVLLLLV